jgi:hypothetical protein
MAAFQQTLDSVQGDRQQAEMLMSTTKCRHRSWRAIVWPSRICWWGCDQQRFHKHDFNWGFGHAKSGGKICDQAVFTGAATALRECTNTDPEFLMTVITGDESRAYGYYPETKVQSSQWKHPTSPRLIKSMTDLKQCEGDTDCFFFRVSRCCESWVCTTRPNCQ